VTVSDSYTRTDGLTDVRDASPTWSVRSD